MHDIGIEVDNGSCNYQRNESLKGLENTLTLLFFLNRHPLKIWATLHPLFSFFLENFYNKKTSALVLQTSGL